MVGAPGNSPNTRPENCLRVLNNDNHCQLGRQREQVVLMSQAVYLRGHDTKTRNKAPATNKYTPGPPQHLCQIADNSPHANVISPAEHCQNCCEQSILEAGFHSVSLVATLAGEPLYPAFGYEVAERYEIATTGGLSLPVVRMTKKMMSGTGSGWPPY